MSTVPLNSKTQGGVGDAGRTLTVCRTLVADRDDMVVKAMSWALRELAKRDRAAVEAFLWEQTESLAAQRVVREVRNKLDTGRKNPKAKVSHPRSRLTPVQSRRYLPRPPTVSESEACTGRSAKKNRK